MRKSSASDADPLETKLIAGTFPASEPEGLTTAASTFVAAPVSARSRGAFDAGVNAIRLYRLAHGDLRAILLTPAIH